MKTFLQIDKELFEIEELSPIEMMIISQIREFIRNGKECFISDKQMAENFHVSTKTISRAIKKCAEMGIIVRDTAYIEGKGGRERKLTINEEAMDNLSIGSRQNDQRAMDNLSIGSRQNDLIKDNIKDNIKGSDFSPEGEKHPLNQEPQNQINQEPKKKLEEWSKLSQEEKYRALGF